MTVKTDSASLWESIRATDEQRNRINETMQVGERLLWLGRPKPGAAKLLLTWASLVFAVVFNSVVFCWFWLVMLWPAINNVNLQEDPWFHPIILAVVALLLLTAIAAQLPRLWANRCDVYAVTNRRAIALIRGPFRCRLNAWDAQDYLDITRGKNGAGSIIYEYRETRKTTYPAGLLDLPDVETVAALIEKAGDTE